MARKKKRRKTAKRRKTTKRKTSRNKSKRRSTRKRKTTRSKRKRSTRKRKTARNKRKRSTRRKKSTSRKRSTRRNKRRSSRGRSRSRRYSRRLPSRMNTMFRVSANKWPFDAPIKHSRAAKKGARKRKRKTRGYKRSTGAKYPLIRNPRNMNSTLGANLRAIISMPVMIDALQITAGSVGAPLLGGSLKNVINNATGSETIKSGGMMEIGVNGFAGAALATAATAVSGSSKIGKNIIYGTIGGLFSRVTKGFVNRMLTKDATGATPDQITPAEGGGEGISGVRSDVAREVASMQDRGTGLGAYATGREVIQSAIEEQF